MRPRHGFTLLEVLIAVFLVDIGLLALVAASAVLVRQATDLRLRSTALRVATNRLQLLGAAPCIAASGTASGPSGVREQWGIDPPQNGVREIHDSVTYALSGSVKRVVLRTRLPC